MIETDDYIVLVEQPAQWGLVPGRHWMSGWFVAKPGRIYHDIRAWIDDVCYLGILGLPRRDLHARFNYGLNSLLSEFFIEFDTWPGAARVRLEVLDEHYRWTEVWRSDLLVLGEPVAPPRPQLPAKALPRLVEAILKDHARRPLLPLDTLVDAHVAPCAAFFLERHPHRPFDGFIDHPAMIAPTQFDRVTLKGWVFHPEQPITRLLGCTGGSGLVHLDHGAPRPEVAARFPQFPLAAKSQFFGFADADARAPNPLLVRVYAELANGEFHIVFARRFFQRPTADAEAAFPSGGKKLLRTVLAVLRDSCARHRVDLPPARAARAELRELTANFLGKPWPAPVPRAPRPASAVPATGPRVLLLSHNLNLEGAPLFLFELAAWLRTEAGFSVTILSGAEGPLRARYEQLGIAVDLHDPTDLAAPASPAAFHTAVEKLAARLRATPGDLVLANTLVSFWGAQLAAALGRPSILYIHESATIPRFFFEKLPAACLPLVHAALTLADRVAFLTPTTRAYYEAHRAAGNFMLVSSWIRLAEIRAFRAKHARDGLRRRHGIPLDALVVANIGTVCERKGQQVYVRAIELLRRRQPALYPAVQFLMVGGRATDFQRGLKEDIAFAGIDDRVRIVEETGSVYDFYALADLFVCTSFEESFPRVVLEAMAFELPIISTDVHGVPEIVRDGVEARLVPSGSPGALADAMAEVLRDPAAARARAVRATERVDQRFAHHRILPQHATLLAGMAASSR